MQLKVRRWQAIVEEKLEEAGRPADEALRKAAIVAFVENPMPAGTWKTSRP